VAQRTGAITGERSRLCCAGIRGARVAAANPSRSSNASFTCLTAEPVRPACRIHARLAADVPSRIVAHRVHATLGGAVVEGALEVAAAGATLAVLRDAELIGAEVEAGQRRAVVVRLLQPHSVCTDEPDRVAAVDCVVALSPVVIARRAARGALGGARRAQGRLPCRRACAAACRGAGDAGRACLLRAASVGLLSAPFGAAFAGASRKRSNKYQPEPALEAKFHSPPSARRVPALSGAFVRKYRTRVPPSGTMSAPEIMFEKPRRHFGAHGVDEQCLAVLDPGVRIVSAAWTHRDVRLIKKHGLRIQTEARQG
jgi:hypothetical protein